jgi:MFS family permease
VVHRAGFLTAGAVLLVMMAGLNTPTPLYQLYGQRFDFSPFTLTLIFASWVFTAAPALLVFGPLGDAIGRRRVLGAMLGTCGCAREGVYLPE